MRKQGLFIVFFICCFFFSRSGDPVGIARVSQLYNIADSLFSLKNPTDVTDATAKAHFDDVIEACGSEPGIPDSLLFHSLWKRGVLDEILGNFDSAKYFYLRSLSLAHQKKDIPDSLQFKPLLYAGGIYYRENKFDSTRMLLEKAQSLSEQYAFTDELERLYNILGALYFEGGNYLQSKNCFEKALQIIENDKGNTVKKINFETNIAAAQNRLGNYEEALQRYLSLLKYKEYTVDISLNIGNIYTALEQYNAALHYFYDCLGSPRIEVLNYIAKAHLMLGQYDSTEHYLSLFENRASASEVETDRINWGVHYICKGDYLRTRGDIADAVGAYQHAIVQLMYDFSDSSVYSNPSDFSGTLSSFNLYDAILKKAACFKMLYNRDRSVDNLNAAMETYISAIDLTDYLERTMDSDESKIFLKRNSGAAYNSALDMVMDLYAINHDNALLWKAYTIIERNKSSVLVSNLKAFQVKSRAQIPEDILQQERDLKYSIARLQIKLDQGADSAARQKMVSEKRNDELALAVIQTKIRHYTGAADLNEAGNFSAHQQFFKDNLTGDQAILDLYFSDSLLYMFAITNNDIHAAVIPQKQLDLEKVEQVQRGFQHPGNVPDPAVDPVVHQLYNVLISPLLPYIRDRKEWIVLPDRIFYYFPFEIIADPATGRMLIEDYSISYNFSTQFIAGKSLKRKQKDPKLIALAPFISQGMYCYEDSILLDRLPATQMEINGLKGEILKDTIATKSAFIKAANHYDILHLATHAVMDPSNPSQSYIAFYPEDSTRHDSFKLYLNELYNLDLDSTRLMLLSACETGIGKFIEGEGVMSLSRGVLYAGCPSVVTTLWPANDQSTAYIINHFYRHMDEGQDLTTALRLAKLDFIKDYPRQKNPSYWAHLALIGQTSSLYQVSFKMNLELVLICLGIAVLGGAVYSYIRFRRRKSPGANVSV